MSMILKSYCCLKMKIKVVELPVTWKHVSDSKVNIIVDSFKTFIKILLIKMKYN